MWTHTFVLRECLSSLISSFDNSSCFSRTAFFDSSSTFYVIALFLSSISAWSCTWRQVISSLLTASSSTLSSSNYLFYLTSFSIACSLSNSDSKNKQSIRHKSMKNNNENSVKLFCSFLAIVSIYLTHFVLLANLKVEMIDLLLIFLCELD